MGGWAFERDAQVKNIFVESHWVWLFAYREKSTSWTIILLSADFGCFDDLSNYNLNNFYLWYFNNWHWRYSLQRKSWEILLGKYKVNFTRNFTGKTKGHLCTYQLPQPIMEIKMRLCVLCSVRRNEEITVSHYHLLSRDILRSSPPPTYPEKNFYLIFSS